MKSQQIVKNLSGYIEILVSDYLVQRVYLPSMKKEVIFQKDVKNLVIDFALFPNGEDHLFHVAGYGDLPSRLVMLSKTGQLKTILSGAVAQPSFSPIDTFFVYLCGANERRQDSLIPWVADWYLCTAKEDGTYNRQISKRSLYLSRPSWFPDGQRLAVASKDLAIYIIDINTGVEQKIIDFGFYPTVSHDGKKISYLSKDLDETAKEKMRRFQAMTRIGYEKDMMPDERAKREITNLFYRYSLFLYDVPTGKSNKLTEELSIESPVLWSPDDKYLMYNKGPYGHDIYVLDIGTGERERVDRLHGRVMEWRN